MAENYVLLETIQLTQNAASVTFDNIPQTGYTDLKVDMSVRGTTAQIYTLMDIWFNGSTTGFSSRGVEGNGSSAVSYTNPSIYLNAATGANATANTFSSNSVYIPNYTSSNFKSVSVDGVLENNATTAYASLQAGLWSNTAAITSIQIIPRADSLAAGSTFSLYGVAALGTTPTVAPKATGGNIVANDGTYWYHAFLTSGNFVPQTSITCDYLVVAGGGSGGYRIGGGGGAGGFRASATNALTATNYAVIVGAGGASTGLNSSNGSNSSFNSFTSNGGGYGGTGDALNSAGSGGSGGGGSHQTGGQTPGSGNTPSTSPSQGNNGGTGFYSGGPNAHPGGGGGAGSAGSNGSSGQSGAGGSGTNTYNSINVSSWLSATGTGVSGVLAGGGGAGCNNTNGSPGSGGGAGAGNGGGNSSATNATANTGSGGGGQRNDTNPAGQGGSGIVIIRYTIA